MNRLVPANLSKGQGNCTDTTSISSGMWVVVHIYIFYQKFTTDHTVNSLFVAMVDLYN